MGLFSWSMRIEGSEGLEGGNIIHSLYPYSFCPKVFRPLTEYINIIRDESDGSTFDPYHIVKRMSRIWPGIQSPFPLTKRLKWISFGSTIKRTRTHAAKPNSPNCTLIPGGIQKRFF